MISRRMFLSGLGVITVGTHLPQIAYSESIKAISTKLARDPMRPQFHLLPAANWMNDPNGPVYWKGKYHMFYQYNPNAAYWGDMHWGHAISPDMVHWRHLPVALSPTPGGPDAGGCYTGTAVVDGGQVTIIYTGVVPAPENQATARDGVHSTKETQCLATSVDPELRTWTKLPAPIISAPPAHLQENGFRDPSPWRQGDVWYMIVGSGTPQQGGLILLYRSTDLRHWEYQHVAAYEKGLTEEGKNPNQLEGEWECPDLFPLEDKHVLMYSTIGYTYWHTGKLDLKQMVFHSEASGTLDYGTFYAAKTQLDKSGNRIAWGWIQETRPRDEFVASGWAGLMSLPRVLTLAPNGRISMQVAPAIEKLRKHHQSFNPSTDDQKNKKQIAKMFIADCCGEIICKMKRSTELIGISINGDSQESAKPWLTLQYDPARPDRILIEGKDIPFDPSGSDELTIHCYIDGSVIEAFVNNQAAYTKRFYYSGPVAPKTNIQIIGNTTNLSSLSIWQISPISSDRLTT